MTFLNIEPTVIDHTSTQINISKRFMPWRTSTGQVYWKQISSDSTHFKIHPQSTSTFFQSQTPSLAKTAFMNKAFSVDENGYMLCDIFFTTIAFQFPTFVIIGNSAIVSDDLSCQNRPWFDLYYSANVSNIAWVKIKVPKIDDFFLN